MTARSVTITVKIIVAHISMSVTVKTHERNTIWTLRTRCQNRYSQEKYSIDIFNERHDYLGIVGDFKSTEADERSLPGPLKHRSKSEEGNLSRTQLFRTGVATL